MKKDVMNKDEMICFRTHEELRIALETIAEEGHRSVSSTIETIIEDYLRHRKIMHNVGEEKRRYPRTKVHTPALVSTPEGSTKAVQAGVILDISLGGLQIAMPKSYAQQMSENGEKVKIELIFTLDGSAGPLTMQCMPNRVSPANGDIRLGASFVDSDFLSLQRLQDYLIFVPLQP